MEVLSPEAQRRLDEKHAERNGQRYVERGRRSRSGGGASAPAILRQRGTQQRLPQQPEPKPQPQPQQPHPLAGRWSIWGFLVAILKISAILAGGALLLFLLIFFVKSIYFGSPFWLDCSKHPVIPDEVKPNLPAAYFQPLIKEVGNLRSILSSTTFSIQRDMHQTGITTVLTLVEKRDSAMNASEDVPRDLDLMVAHVTDLTTWLWDTGALQLSQTTSWPFLARRGAQEGARRAYEVAGTVSKVQQGVEGIDIAGMQTSYIEQHEAVLAKHFGGTFEQADKAQYKEDSTAISDALDKAGEAKAAALKALKQTFVTWTRIGDLLNEAAQSPGKNHYSTRDSLATNFRRFLSAFAICFGWPANDSAFESVMRKTLAKIFFILRPTKQTTIEDILAYVDALRADGSYLCWYLRPATPN
ncbi:hypothetical protein LTR17_022041 [Elasticomyces elasticus]|nr:hypothetical protein LTR17_022041 [Elasticomyces elasticus]